MKYDEKNAKQMDDYSIRKIESKILSVGIKSYNFGLADVLWLGVGGVVALDIFYSVYTALEIGIPILSLPFLLLFFPALIQIFAGVMTILRFYQYKGDSVAIATTFVIPKLFLLLTLAVLFAINPQSITLIIGQSNTFFAAYAILNIVGIVVWSAYFYCSFEVECAIPKEERFWSKLSISLLIAYAIYYVCYGAFFYYCVI